MKGVRVKYDQYTKGPESVLSFNSVPNGGGGKLHPTQKPVDLMEYLIKTYSNEGDVVLDNAMGSGTTCVAAINLKRGYIGIEKDPEFYTIAEKRVAEAHSREAV